VILLAFAVAIGSLTVQRLRSDFNREVGEAARAIPNELKVRAPPFEVRPELRYLATPGDHAVIRLLSLSGVVVRQYPVNAPTFPIPPTFLASGFSVQNIAGYRVVTELVNVVSERGFTEGRLIVQYGRQIGPTERTVRRVELFLLLGVLAGSFLALLAGMAVARRAMAPIAELTSTAGDIARTRDPSRRVPEPQAEDEVAELARTLESMLRELDSARADTEEALARQRQFVADASHELRTPLTSVLANLELLAARGQLPGDLGDAARSALRSSQRMRRLVADLLLLARTDAARVGPHQPLDLAQVVVEASAEIGSVSEEHEVVLDVEEAPVTGARDDLHRLVLNLIENSIRHTPPGTHVRVSTRVEGDEVVLVVEDDGPGVPDEIAARIFERFVRGAGDRGGSFGLGLAIVSAVAASHGGSVTLDRNAPEGARFVVRLPARRPAPEPAAPPETVLADRAV
jgi:two-component system, OmpR family, sensor kinase